MAGGRAGAAVRVAGGLAVAVVFLLPLYFLVVGSLREAGVPPPRTPELLPRALHPENYERASELGSLGRAAANSLLVAALAVPLSIVVASWAGFALAQLRGRATSLVVGASLVALMIPSTALLVPRFALYRELGLIDTYVPLVAPALLGMSPFAVLIFWWSFNRLPRGLFDAARIEGITPFGAWWRIGMPLVRPATGALATLAFISTWGNVLDPLVYLFDPDLYTLPLRLRALAQLDAADAPVYLAGAVAATIPVLLVFLVAQRFFLDERGGAGWLGRE